MTERIEAKILFGATAVFILQFAYLLIPYSEELHQPFPFYKFQDNADGTQNGITWQTYYDYIFRSIGYIILLYIVSNYVPGLNRSIKVLGWLWWGYIIEYLLIYNQEFLWIRFIPISYSLFAGLAMVLIVCHEFFKKK